MQALDAQRSEDLKRSDGEAAGLRSELEDVRAESERQIRELRAEYVQTPAATSGCHIA